MLLTDDLDIFMGLEFAQAVKIGSVEIVGILDEGSVETQFVDTIEPTFTAKTSEIADYARGTLITKSDGKIFKIVTMPPDDGKGLTAVKLERQ